MKTQQHSVIAIDGPAASGKGTIASRVAKALGWSYLDSGALYRVTALWASLHNIATTDEKALAALALQLPVDFSAGKVFLDGKDASEAIRTEVIGKNASEIAKFPSVRQALLQTQREWAHKDKLVADGRDMASVVFPDADLKVFLTATADVRAQRRAKQIGVEIGSPAFAQILNDIHARDLADSQRTTAPLVRVPDAKLLDTSEMTIEEAVQKVLDWYRQK